MHIPDNMTKDQVVDQINVVVNRIAPKYTFYGYQADDSNKKHLSLHGSTTEI